MNLQTFTKETLTELEAIAARRLTRRKRNQDLFEKDQADEKAYATKLEELRKRYAEECLEGPPEGWEKTAYPATGLALKVEVQFRGGDPTYDPTKLPAAILQAPGVVAKIDPKAVEAIVATNPSRFDVKDAVVPVGPWQKPTVLVKPIVP